MEDQGLDQARAEAQAPRPSRGRAIWGAAIVVLVAVGVFGGWLAFSGTWRAWGAVASLNGTRVTRAELDQHMDFLMRQGRIRPDVLAEPARRKEAERAALDDLITRRLLLAEAQRMKIEVGPGEEDVAFRTAHGGQPGQFKLADIAKKRGEDVDRLREEVRRQLVLTRLADKITEDVKMTDEDVAKYYETHRRSFTAPGEVHLRLLIVDSREEAERLRAQAQAKGSDFAALVRQYSKGGHKENGGDMGWVDPRVLPASIAKAVADVPQHGITPVVEGKGSFYVLRVEDRRPPRQVSLAEEKDAIMQVITAERKQAKFAEWLEERRRAAKIEIYL